MQLLSLRRRRGWGGDRGTDRYLLPWLPANKPYENFNCSVQSYYRNSKKLTVQNVKPWEIIPFLRLTSEPFKKLHKCDRVLKTRPCNAMSNGIGKDMHFRCHIQNAHKVNMSMGQKMLYRISKAPFLVLEPKALLLNVQLRKVHCSYNTNS